LLKPDANDLYAVSIQNGNMDKLDTVGGIRRVTSGTRPTAPLVDSTIHETDTGKILTWDGDSWEEVFDPADYVPPPAAIVPPTFIGGKRYDGSSAVLATLGNNANETLTGMDTGTRAVEANTAYSVNAAVDFDSTVAGDRFDFRLRLTDVTGTVLALSNNVLFSTAATRQTLYLEGYHLQGAAPGNIFVVVTMQRRSGTGTGRIYKSTTTRPWTRVDRLGASSLWTQV
jgi:hypothetical protein